MRQLQQLLTRDQFREGVFARDKHQCVICGQPAVDAHHIIERRLFDDGGYYLDNGASLCQQHHLEAEKTTISCEQIREAIGIKHPVLPQQLYSDARYDKWGNQYLTNGQRLKGDLFHDASVQKILAAGGVLDQFTEYVKYPRTFHVPWTGYKSKDDRTMDDDKIQQLFAGQIIVTEKMDGENTTMYRDKMHARSVDGNSHWTQSWVRQLHSTIAHDIPPGWRICGENLFAKHSIAYDALSTYFLVFSIWDDHNRCLSWHDTLTWAALLNLTVVPTLYAGLWTDVPANIHRVWTQARTSETSEGYVIRNAEPFWYSGFRDNVAKYVRPNHVTTSSHWKFEKIERNTLKRDDRQI